MPLHPDLYFRREALTLIRDWLQGKERSDSFPADRRLAAFSIAS